MGSLASRPKAPSVPSVQYVYVPAAPSYTPPAATPPSVAAPNDDMQADNRHQNLLERRRSRLGTVLTSFRGLLNDSVSGARKTLLGE